MTDLTPSSLLSWRRRPFEWLNVCADENALVAEEFARENLRRLRLAAPTIVLVNLIVFLMFLLNDVAADAQQARWSTAVLLSVLFAGTGYLKTDLCGKLMWCDAVMRLSCSRQQES